MSYAHPYAHADAQSYPNADATIGLDTDPSRSAANTATSLGSIESCTSTDSDTIVNPDDRDDDGDGWDDWKEYWMSTDSLDDCADQPGDLDAWPPDIDMDTTVGISDVILGMYGKMLVPEKYDRRADVNADGQLSISDVIIGFSGRIGDSCAS